MSLFEFQTPYVCALKLKPQNFGFQVRIYYTYLNCHFWTVINDYVYLKYGFFQLLDKSGIRESGFWTFTQKLSKLSFNIDHPHSCHVEKILTRTWP